MRRGPLVWLLVAPAVLAGCATPAEGPLGASATVTWTAYGIPHVTASDWKGLGYGYGYAVARDALCTLAEEFMTVAGERTRHLPLEGTYTAQASGATYTNAASDLFFAFVAENPDLYAPVDLAASPRTRDLVDGFVAGYNRRVAEVTAPCDGAPWVRPITDADIVRRAAKLQLLASSHFLGQGIVTAAPPDGDDPAERFPAVVRPSRLGIGSNAYAFGRDTTADGRGLLLGNPHFPWQGPERFHQFHLTIPGEVDVMGATLLGMPAVAIGFTRDFAWSHTVSTAWRFTLHELKLVPGRPTAYVVDGQVEEMEAREVRVGDLATTVYVTRYGPIVEAAVAGTDALLAWDATRAYAIRDANAQNPRLLEQFLEMNTARDLDAFVDAVQRVHGIPWVNTIAAGADGRVVYADVSVVPNVDAAKIQECNTALGRATFAAARLPILDGSRAACDWTCEEGTAQACIIPADAMPLVVRLDWVMNSNDSHWLPNPDAPLEGYSPMIGDERTQRSGRTRMGYVLVEERLAGEARCDLDPGVACDRMTAARLEDALFSSRIFYAEATRDALVQQACALPVAASSSGEAVDLAEACRVLAAWDLRADLDSRGIALFERFWSAVPDQAHLWTTPFDASDPVRTPAGYVAASPLVRTALADAVLELRRAGVALDAPARDVRGVTREGAWIPVHGALGDLGSPSYVRFPFDAERGFLEPEHGNSYMQVVGFDARGPVADTLLAYSQSPEDGHPHRADQTRLYAEKRWVRAPFHAEDVRAGAVETLELRG